MKLKMSKVISVILAMIIVAVAAAGVLAFAAEEATAIPVRDIYVVLDTSESMKGKHMTRLKNDSKDFIKAVLEAEGDNRIALVVYNDNATVYPFSTDYDEMAAIIDGLEAGGKSNMVGFLRAIKDADAANPDASPCKRIVVFGDGLPDVGGELDSGKYSWTDSPCYYKYGNAVIAEAEAMWPDFEISTVGITHCCGGVKYNFRKAVMRDMANKLYQEEYNRDPLLAAVLAKCMPKPAPTTQPEPESQEPEAPVTEPPVPTEPATPAPTAPSTEPQNVTVVVVYPTAGPVAPTTAPAPCTCAPTTAAPTTCAPETTTKAPEKTTPKTGDAKVAVIVAAVAMTAAIGIVGAKKRH